MQKNANKKPPSKVLDKLPTFQNAVYQPHRFEDSTHELWLLKNSNSPQENLFLKVCNNTNSPFWEVMQHLFDYELQTSIHDFQQLYTLIDATTPLEIPTLIMAQSKSADADNEAAFILTSAVKGAVVGDDSKNNDNSDVNLKMVEQLAQHVAGLHQKKHTTWGAFNSPEFKQEQWPDRLKLALRDFAKKQNIPKEFEEEALNACQFAASTDFVTMMPDLRWDQFLHHEGQLSALVDLDAFVLAPRELDFVLLEYILTAVQHSQFIQTYVNSHPIPDISKVRPAYRLLLFLMQVLGEQNIEKWMNAEHRF